MKCKACMEAEEQKKDADMAQAEAERLLALGEALPASQWVQDALMHKLQWKHLKDYHCTCDKEGE